MSWEVSGSGIWNWGKSPTDKRRSFKGYFILAKAIEKWNVSLKITGINQSDGFPDAIKVLQIAFASKNFEDSK